VKMAVSNVASTVTSATDDCSVHVQVCARQSVPGGLCPACETDRTQAAAGPHLR
jgi:hypothetical protein